MVRKKIKQIKIFPSSKRAWIKIVEAFISILLITGVMLIIIDKGYIGKSDISSKVHDAQISILREIELDDNLRSEILSVVETPVEWKYFEENGLTNVKNKINNRVPNYLICEAKVCKLDEICVLEEYIDKDVYAQPVAITANLTKYDPKQLKLFCWTG